MLHARWEKILRDVRLRKARTALVAASIFIGVLGVVTLFSMGEILLRALESSVQTDRLPMLRVYLLLKGETEAGDTGFLEPLRDLPDVESVQAMALYPVYWKLPGADSFDEGRIFGYSDPFDDLTIEPVELVAGHWPEAGQNEIVVERRFASAHGVRPGDTLVLRVLSGDTTHEESWAVVGTVFQPYSYPLLPGAPTQISTSTMIFAAAKDALYITGVQRFNLIQVRYTTYAAAEEQAGTFKAAIAEQTPYVPSIALLEDPAKNYWIEQTRIMSNVLSLLAMVALLVSGFLVLNVINAMVIEQRRQIGIMKSLGATGLDNFVMYAGIALAYGLIGVVPGVLFGIPAGFSGAENIAPQFNILLERFTVSPPAIVIGALLGVLVPVLSALPPVLGGIRVTILEAITNLGIDATYAHGPLARLVDRVPLPISLRQALRNVLKKKGRLALTVFTLALAAGAFMGVYATMSAFNTLLHDTLDQIGIDISITPPDTADYERVRDLVQRNVPGIKAIEPGTTLAIDIDGYTPTGTGGGPAFMVATGINPANPNIVTFKLRSGRAWKDDPLRSGVVISSTIADGLGLNTGDRLTFHAGGKPGTFDVLGVAEYSFDTLWIRWDDLSRMGGLVANAPVPNQYVTSIQVDGEPTTAIGINEQARPLLTLTSGQFFTPGEPGALISAELAAARGYAVGDMLELASGTTTKRVPVTGVFEIPPQLRQPDQPDEVIALYWEDLAALEGLPLDGEPLPNTLQIVLERDNPTAAQVSDTIDTINEMLLANGINAVYTNWVESGENVTRTLNTAEIVLNTAAALIGAVGAIGLLSTLSMSVFERQKEIGVMRSIGASSGTIAIQFLTEGLITGVIAWVVGIPLSYGLYLILLDQFGFGGVLAADYPPVTLALGLGSTLVIATAASLWPSLGAARKTVSDILRYQ
jgi:putative ABC transport system permease protein